MVTRQALWTFQVLKTWKVLAEAIAQGNTIVKYGVSSYPNN
jgi:hypothetical protein